MRIKICDIKDVHTARLCGNAKVDMIGLHAIRKLKKKNIKPYRLICEELRTFYPKTTPVLVTKIKDSSRLIGILKQIFFEYVQLYILDEKSLTTLRKKLEILESNNISNGINPAQTQLLDELVYELGNIKWLTNSSLNREVKFILAVPVSGLHIKFLIYILKKTKAIADLFLLDTTVEGGTGVLADTKNTKILLRETQSVETFIAGGLDPENVQSIIQNLAPLKPIGVDVQSGVSDLKKNRGDSKNPQLVIDFISRVRYQNKEIVKRNTVRYPVTRNQLISWAITDLQAAESFSRMFSIMQKTDIDIVHIDFSDGSIAPNFIRMPFDLLEYFTYYFPCMNYDIHLFIRDVEGQTSVINECLKRNILLRTVYFHVLSEDNIIGEKLASISDICRGFGINLGVAIQSTQFNEHTLKDLFESILNQERRPLISEISLITHSKNHPLSEAIEHDRQILSSLVKDNSIFSIHALISIDRDMTLEKAKGLTWATGVNQIIVGKDLNDKIQLLLNNKTDRYVADFLQNYINRYRRLLNNARNRNAN